jgi:hypothetical protein
VSWRVTRRFVPWLLQCVFAVDVLKREKCGGRLRHVLGERAWSRAPPVAELPASTHGQLRLAFNELDGPMS